MKFLSCNAITGTAAQITASNCMTLLGQAKRIGYFELPQTAAIGDATSTLAQGTYTALQAASDISKMILPKPKIYGPELTGTEPVTVGSNDNTTPDGITIMRGQTVPTFTGKYTGLNPTQYGQFEDLFARGNQNADFDTLGGIFFLGDRQVIMTDDFKPIPFHSIFIGDPTGMQLHDLTQFMFRFEMEKGWYRSCKVFDLNFNHKLL
ncbi:hypothetical protein [Spirosoma foliorum]|uniref:Uncharacterized protein n=1 Tax=Spirosoma foliorum TaxID=2710596 RepID=A0A7G5H5J0_9BACT|nr:hypothetical protein [Spirosoma foliorum]QMW06382.1 hypothetical protein H3H32_16565 [Spirosoma foliorum]